MLGAAAVVASAAVLTNLGAGPFASPATPFSGVLSLQLFLALAAVMTLMISMAAEENRALLVALTSGNRRQRRETRLLRDEIERNRVLEQQRLTAERRNAQLAALVRHSQEFIGIATLDGRGDFINDIGRELIGIGPEEDASRYSISDLVHPREHEPACPRSHTDGDYARPLVRRAGLSAHQRRYGHPDAGDGLSHRRCRRPSAVDRQREPRHHRAQAHGGEAARQRIALADDHRYRAGQREDRQVNTACCSK